jgi:hypothetical protein
VSERQLPSPGIYKAKTNGNLVVYIVEKSGNLAVAISYTLLESSVPFSGKGQVVIAKADGALETKSIAKLRKMFPGWTESSPKQLNTLDTSEDVFEVDGVIEEVTPRATDDVPNPKPYDNFKARFFNPVGGSLLMPDAAADEDIMERWGSAFKSTAPRSSSAPAQTKSSEPEKKKAPSRPPKEEAKALNSLQTGDDVWEAYLAKAKKENPKAKADDLENPKGAVAKKFWSTAEAINQSGDLSKEQWAQCADELGV